MNLLVWNCRGLGNPRKVQALQDIIQQKDPKLVFLCETKCKAEFLNGLRIKLGFRRVFGVSSNGQSRGLGLFWSGDINLIIISSSERFIDSEIGAIGDAVHWRFTGFYEHQATKERQISWDIMRQLATSCSLPWLIGGDFNELLGIHEKEGGPVCPMNQIMAFQNAVCDCHLHDLDFLGTPYTWITTRAGVSKNG
ncbi:hypothetical protein ACFX2G_022945 [Malus domestica]